MKTVKDKAYSYEHCKERASQRYDLTLTLEIYKEWDKLVRQSPAIHTNTDKDTVQTTHVIYWQDTKIICVFENKRDCITTLLPPEKDLHFCGRLNDKPRFCECGNWHRPSAKCPKA